MSFAIQSKIVKCGCQLRHHVLNANKYHYTWRAASTQIQSHYETLGISKNADSKEIRDAFIKKSKELHPDSNPNDPLSHEKFVKINEAYSVLQKSSSRQDYDFKRTYGPQPNKSQRYGSYYHEPDREDPFRGSEYERVIWEERMKWEKQRRQPVSPHHEEASWQGMKFCGIVILVGFGWYFMSMWLSMKAGRRMDERSRMISLSLKKDEERFKRMSPEQREADFILRIAEAEAKIARDRKK